MRFSRSSWFHSGPACAPDPPSAVSRAVWPRGSQRLVWPQAGFTTGPNWLLSSMRLVLRVQNEEQMDNVKDGTLVVWSSRQSALSQDGAALRGEESLGLLRPVGRLQCAGCGAGLTTRHGDQCL